MQRFESLLSEWHDYITDDLNNLYLIEKYLADLNTPFGFLKSMTGGRAGAPGLNDEDREDMRQQLAGDTQYH